jgi:hypothetical protein
VHFSGVKQISKNDGVLQIHYQDGRRQRTLKLWPAPEKLHQWWYKLQQALALRHRARVGASVASEPVPPLYYQLERQLGAEGQPTPAVLVLRVIDGHVWSASSSLTVVEWRLARARGTDQRHIEVGRSITVDSSMLGKHPLCDVLRLAAGVCGWGWITSWCRSRWRSAAWCRSRWRA